MKAKLLAVAIPALFMTSSVFATEGETSNVKFNGEITQATCALNNDSKNQTVELGTVTTNAFTEGNKHSAAKTFTIGLESCDADTLENASIAFSGDTADETSLASSNKTVGIQILNESTPVVLDGQTPAATQTSQKDGTNIFSFSARYVALDEVVEAGPAIGQAKFTVSYD